MVDRLAEVVSIPRPLLKELYEHVARLAEILATLEELANQEGVNRIETSLEEYQKKKCITVRSPGKIREALMKD